MIRLHAPSHVCSKSFSELTQLFAASAAASAVVMGMVNMAEEGAWLYWADASSSAVATRTVSVSARPSVDDAGLLVDAALSIGCAVEPAPAAVTWEVVLTGAGALVGAAVGAAEAAAGDVAGAWTDVACPATLVAAAGVEVAAAGVEVAAVPAAAEAAGEEAPGAAAEVGVVAADTALAAVLVAPGAALDPAAAAPPAVLLACTGCSAHAPVVRQVTVGGKRISPYTTVTELALHPPNATVVMDEAPTPAPPPP